MAFEWKLLKFMWSLFLDPIKIFFRFAEMCKIGFFHHIISIAYSIYKMNSFEGLSFANFTHAGAKKIAAATEWRAL